MLKKIIILLLIFFNNNALALIRDAEVELTLEEYFQPIFKSAGVKPDIYIINSSVLNAFVAEGQNIFIHTGLILALDRPEMLIGVVAHETGHITGGHLIAHKRLSKKITVQAALGYILGAAAAVAGAGDAGVAIMSAGTTYAHNNFMSYSRVTEQVADRAAIEFLTEANIPIEGLVDTFELLRREEKVHQGGSSYSRSHPITTQRIENIRSYITGKEKKIDNFKYERIKVKLAAFLGVQYTPKIKSWFLNKYREAIVYYSIGKIDKSIEVINLLIKNNPKDAFVYELKGQVLFENGRTEEAVKAYQKAFNLLPHSLIRYGLGVAQISTDDKQKIKRGINNINSAMVFDKGLPSAYHYLSVGYNKIGNKGMELLSLAEKEMIMGNKKEAIAYANKALKIISKNTPAYFKASDFIIINEKD